MIKSILYVWVNKLFFFYNWFVDVVVQSDDSSRRKQQEKIDRKQADRNAGRELRFSFIERLKLLILPDTVPVKAQINLFRTILKSIDFQSPFVPIFDDFRWRTDISPVARKKFDGIYRTISGKRLYHCLEQVGGFFDEHITLLRIAETKDGNLKDALRSIIQDLTEISDRRRTAKFLMITPLFIVALILSSEIFCALYVAPSVESVLQGAVEIPPTIKSFLTLKSILDNRKLEFSIYLLIAAAIIYLLSYLNRNKVFFHWFLLQFPFLRKLIQTWEMAKFLKGITLMLNNSSSMPEAVAVSLKMVNNRIIRASLKRDLSDVNKQSNLPMALSNSIYLDLEVRNQLRYNKDRDVSGMLTTIVEEYDKLVKPLLESPLKAIAPATTVVAVTYLVSRLFPLLIEMQELFSTVTKGGV